MRTDRISPLVLITTPDAIRRRPAAGWPAVYSRATTDSRALASAESICRSNSSMNASTCSAPVGTPTTIATIPLAGEVWPRRACE